VAHEQGVRGAIELEPEGRRHVLRPPLGLERWRQLDLGHHAGGRGDDLGGLPRAL